MSVSAVRSRSVSSATTLSLSSLCIHLLLYETSPHGGGLAEDGCAPGAASGGLLRLVAALPPVSGDGRVGQTVAGSGSPVSSSTMSRVRVGSTWIPGPIVLVSVIRLM